MINENPVPLLSEWIGPALLMWLIVVAVIAAAAVVVGLAVSVLRYGPGRAFGVTARSLASVIRDLVLISPRRLAALVWLAIKESIRHKVILVGFGVFMLVLLFAGWFLDPASVEPARLYMNAVLTTSTYLVLLLMLFLSVFSLPADLRSGTLHTVVTKPVRTSEIVLGRMLGFTLMGTTLLLLMGMVSYVFVVRGLAHTHTIASANLKPVGQPEPGKRAALRGLTDPAHGHRHPVYIDSSGSGRIEIERRHWHTLGVEGSGEQSSYTVGPEEGSLVARVPVFGKIAFRDKDGLDTDKGINVGNEWMYRSYITGGSPAAAIWSFQNLSRDAFPDRLPIEMNIEIFRSHKGNIERGILGNVAVRNPDTGLTVWTEIFEAKEFTVKRVDIPTKLSARKVSGVDVVPRKAKSPDGATLMSPADMSAGQKVLTAKRDSEFDLYDDLVTPDGRLEIWLRCVEPGQYFGAAQQDLYLRAPDASFTLNFFKGYLGIWMQMLLVIGFGVMFSTFLSGPVAMIATVGVLVAGMVHPFMADVAYNRSLGGGPFESMIRLGQQTNQTTELSSSLGTEVAQSADKVSRVGLRGAVYLLPSFRDYNYSDFVADGFDIDGNAILVRLLQVLAFFVPVFIAGYLFLKTREVAR